MWPDIDRINKWILPLINKNPKGGTGHLMDINKQRKKRKKRKKRKTNGN